MGVPRGLLYTKDHEWARIEQNNAMVGITYYAQSHLGDVTFVGLPQLGKSFSQFETIATIESTKAAVEIHSPLSGKVIKINESLTSNPELINRSPYDQGWLAVLEINRDSEEKNLLTAGQYDIFLET
ncbi:MAG: glycine cleavage system protein GcvH [Candidatus Omnitrophica bacterium]|nr:glycine cleavage system protein GcvH [Candidatus Omnitrophota bacterium]